MPAAAICPWVVSTVPVYMALQDLNANIILMIVILIHAKMVPNVLIMLMLMIAFVLLVLLVTPAQSKKTLVTKMVLLNIANKIVPCLVLIYQEVITSATAKRDIMEKTVSWILMNVCLTHVNMEETAATPMEILIVPAKMDGRERRVNRLQIFAI